MVPHARLLRRGVQIFETFAHSYTLGPRASTLSASAAFSDQQLAATSAAFSSSSSSWTSNCSSAPTCVRDDVSSESSAESSTRQLLQQHQFAWQRLPHWQQHKWSSSVAWHCQPPQQQQQQQQSRHHHSKPQSFANSSGTGWRQQQQRQRPALLFANAGPHLHQQHRCYHQEQQQQLQQWQKPQAAPSKLTPPAAAAAAAGAVASCDQQRQHVPGSSWTSLPNLLSLSRVVSGPWAAYLVATQQWPLAFAITAAAGVTDWADGYLARRLGHTSKLGSYLDPLADKVLIASVVGAMGWYGMLPAWLAVLVVGRDTAQVSAMFVYRLRMFGGVWPGAAAFFDVDAAVPHMQQRDLRVQEQRHEGVAGEDAISSSSSTSETKAGPAAAAAAVGEGGGLPSLKPLMVSKVNTALVMLLVAGCMTQQWQGLPGQDVLDALELAVAGTTAVSAAAYARLYYTGRLLSSSSKA